MALSFNISEGTGTISEFPITFPYIAKEHIYVKVDDVSVAFTIDTINGVVRLDDVPVNGARIKVFRKTPRDRTYSDFSRGNAFGQRNVNNSFLWLLYISQEISEGTWGDEFEIGRDLDMRGYRIKNVGDAVEGDDAITKKVTDNLNGRLSFIEKGLTSASRFITWTYNAVGGEIELKPPYDFIAARVFIEGSKQRSGSKEDTLLGNSFYVEDNTIHLSQPLISGEWVDVELGTEPKYANNNDEEISRLKANDIVHDAGILANKTSILSNEDSIQVNKHKIDLIGDTLTNHFADISNNTSKIESLQSQGDNVDAEVTDLRNKLSAAEAEIVGLKRYPLFKILDKEFEISVDQRIVIDVATDFGVDFVGEDLIAKADIWSETVNKWQPVTMFYSEGGFGVLCSVVKSGSEIHLGGGNVRTQWPNPYMGDPYEKPEETTSKVRVKAWKFKKEI